MPILAAVPLPAWQAVILVLLSFSSLLIALYCLFFMVPLKKFVQRIESLGGGMEGIKKHLKGLEEYFEKELNRMESNLADRLDSVRNDAEQRTGGLQQKYSELREKIQTIDELCHFLKNASVQREKEVASTRSRLQNVESLISELQRDISVLAQETEGKLNKEVRASYAELEAAVLSTLEVMRDELLINAGAEREKGNGSGVYKEHKQKRPSSYNDENKIISAGPLFARTPPEEAESGNDQPDEDGEK